MRNDDRSLRNGFSLLKTETAVENGVSRMVLVSMPFLPGNECGRYVSGNIALHHEVPPVDTMEVIRLGNLQNRSLHLC